MVICEENITAKEVHITPNTPSKTQTTGKNNIIQIRASNLSKNAPNSASQNQPSILSKSTPNSASQNQANNTLKTTQNNRGQTSYKKKKSKSKSDQRVSNDLSQNTQSSETVPPKRSVGRPRKK